MHVLTKARPEQCHWEVFRAQSSATKLMRRQGSRATAGLLIARALCDSPGSASRLFLHFVFIGSSAISKGSGRAPSRAADAKHDRRSHEQLARFSETAGFCATHPETVRHRVLEVLYCETCGTTFFGGSRLQLRDNQRLGGSELLITK